MNAPIISSTMPTSGQFVLVCTVNDRLYFWNLRRGDDGKILKYQEVPRGWAEWIKESKLPPKHACLFIQYPTQPAKSDKDTIMEAVVDATDNPHNRATLSDTRPAFGIMPQAAWREHRVRDLAEAIARQFERGSPNIDLIAEWASEMEDHATTLQILRAAQ